MFPANSVFNNPTTGTTGLSAFGSGRQNPIATNPLFGRPIWTYTQVDPSPRRGPQPRLAVGTGRTGISANPGEASSLPGYVSSNEYLPSLSGNSPQNRQAYTQPIPKRLPVGDDGLHALNPTYRAHVFQPGTRNFSHMRSAPNWQIEAYPPDYRNLLAWQQVMKYRTQTLTASARPLDSSMYFLGYQVNPQTVAPLGQNILGYMGG